MALPRLTIPPLSPNKKRLVHKYRRVVGRGRTDQLQKIVSISSGDLSPLRIRTIRCWMARPQRVAYMPPALVLVLCVPHGAYFTCHYEGVSHAEWPKDTHE